MKADERKPVKLWLAIRCPSCHITVERTVELGVATRIRCGSCRERYEVRVERVET